MTNPDPAAIARKLTKKQREVLLWLYDAPERVSFDDRLSFLYRGKDARVQRWDLVAPPFGWAVSNEPWQYSPLGARVRAVLLAEAASHE